MTKIINMTAVRDIKAGEVITPEDVTDMEALRHEELMQDPDAFDFISIPVGRRFSISLECVNRKESAAILPSMYNNTLLAGCKVLSVGTVDFYEKYEELKNKVKDLADENNI